MDSRNDAGVRFRSNRLHPDLDNFLTPPPASDGIAVVVPRDPAFTHAGGIQVLGHFLAVQFGNYQSVNLVTQCDGSLFLIGTHKNSVTTQDFADAFRLENDSGFGDRSLMIDYNDRLREDYSNYDRAEGFEDKTSAVRWCLPPGVVYRLYPESPPRADHGIESRRDRRVPD